MAAHILIGFAVAVFCAGSLLVKPFGRCWRCRGARVLISGGRVRQCRACGGIGRRQRTGSKTVHRIRRQVAAHWRAAR